MLLCNVIACPDLLMPLLFPLYRVPALTNSVVHLTAHYCYQYQATSLASDVKGKTPIFSKVLKTASAVRGAAANIMPGHRHSATSFSLEDQDALVQEIALHHRGRRSATKPPMDDGDDTKENSKEDEQRASFSYIITRPTAFLKDGPSTKKVSASKSVRS